MLSSGRWGVHRLSPAQLKLARLSFWAVLWSRVLVWEASAIAARAFGLARLPSAYNPVDLQPHGRSLGALLTFPVIRWDGDWYLAIARHGYALSAGLSLPPRTNFFPLYPLLVGALERIGLPMALAAVAVSITSMWLALYALGRLVELELATGSGKRSAHPDAARLTVIALALSPVSFFLSSAYAESLFLALSVGMFLSARQGRWARAGVCAALASATRAPGLLLVLPALVIYFYGPRNDRPPDRAGRGWRPRYRVRRELAWLALAPIGVLAYMAYLGLSGVDALAFVHTQQIYWHHVLAFPWTTICHGASSAWSELEGIVTGSAHVTLFGTYVGASVATGWENLLPFVALLVAIPAFVGVWRGLPVAYGVYVTAAIALNLVSPVRFQPLQSLPRYLLVLFPLFIWAGAALARHPRVRLPVLVLSSAVLALLAAEFATWHYIA